VSLDVRGDFPLLAREIDGRPITYLDSAATSLKPVAVIEAENAYATRFTSNVHRGVGALAAEATFELEAARWRIARFIGAEPATVILTSGTTLALEMVASGLGLTRADTVLCAPNSHHSNLLPWMRRAKVTYVDGHPLQPLDPDQVLSSIRAHRPRLLAFGWVSNVNGAVSPAEEICRIAREHGVMSVIDAAQAAPHVRVDVDALGCDFLAFSGHKMLGPTGTGVLWGKRELLEGLEPLVLGGGAVDRVTLDSYALKSLPHRLEAGTPNVAGFIGLGAATDYLDGLGAEAVEAHEAELAEALDQALNGLRGAHVLSPVSGARRIAMASIVPLGASLSADTICRALSDAHGVMTRSGLHCAHPLFDGLRLPQGALRISPYLYNTVAEMDALAGQLRGLLGE
jgi:cysteine desulfurase / selenocysteine lyase